MKPQIAPATRYDIASCMGRVQVEAWAIAKAQIEAGPAYALRDEDGNTIAVGGLWPVTADCAEVWFMTTPLARNHIQAIISAIRLTMRCSPYDFLDAAISARGGRRIARLCGFKRHGLRYGVEIWRYGRFDRGRKQERQEGCGAATEDGRGSPAAAVGCSGQTIG